MTTATEVVVAWAALVEVATGAEVSVSSPHSLTLIVDSTITAELEAGAEGVHWAGRDERVWFNERGWQHSIVHKNKAHMLASRCGKIQNRLKKLTIEELSVVLGEAVQGHVPGVVSEVWLWGVEAVRYR